MMRVLFLDIDGVLNSQPWLGGSQRLRRNEIINLPTTDTRIKDEAKREYKLSHLCAENIAVLNKIVEQTNCHIVISSTWRLQYHHTEMASFLSLRGFKFPERIIDSVEHKHDIRGAQINRWLLACRNDVEGICILDDDNFGMEPLVPWLVQTDFWDGGLLPRHVEPVVNLLMEKFEPQNKVQKWKE